MYRFINLIKRAWIFHWPLKFDQQEWLSQVYKTRMSRVRHSIRLRLASFVGSSDSCQDQHEEENQNNCPRYFLDNPESVFSVVWGSFNYNVKMSIWTNYSRWWRWQSQVMLVTVVCLLQALIVNKMKLPQQQPGHVDWQLFISAMYVNIRYW